MPARARNVGVRASAGVSVRAGHFQMQSFKMWYYMTHGQRI